MVVVIGARIGPLLAVVMVARDSDQAIGELLETLDEERMAGARMAVDHWRRQCWLRKGLDPEDAAATLWTLNSAEVRSLLARRGWSDDRYAAWLAGMLRPSVLVEDGSEGRPR